MALIKCKECGKEFSDMAEACPNCGYNPTRAKEKAMGLKPKEERKSKTVALLLTFFLWFVAGGHFYTGNLAFGIAVLIAGSISLVVGLAPIFFFALAIIEIINFIRIASMDQAEFDKTYNGLEK